MAGRTLKARRKDGSMIDVIVVLKCAKIRGADRVIATVIPTTVGPKEGVR